MGSSSNITNFLYECFELLISPLRYSLDAGINGNSLFWLSITFIALGIIAIVLRLLKRFIDV